ncbi:hypothetical protein B0H14DRAFT_1266987 [Mycena olivaceomarginata]|nr:hypothetical protein B0H14DRAFT_1266987 [Mycena olivaceomarginata]
MYPSTSIHGQIFRRFKIFCTVMLRGSKERPKEFADTLSTHIMGLCTNGVFDRFPNLTIIVGHLGERIPSDLWRIDDELARAAPVGLPMLRNLSSYWKTNLLETVSGNFATDLFYLHAKQIGLNRILSITLSYPWNKARRGWRSYQRP